MKKWIATYILFVSCIAFSLSGSANCCNDHLTKAPLLQKTFEFKAPEFISKQPLKEDQQPNEFGRSLVNANAPGFSSIVPFITAERPDLFTYTGTLYSVLVPKTVILKGYLLHLFPSHYFW
jgi:hypothetical protein